MRVDYFFSYWIFAWYILYVFSIVKYNPKFALTIGLIENIIKLFFMIYHKNHWIIIVVFFVANFLMKVIPLWSLRSTKYTKTQFITTLGLFMIYVTYLYMNNTSFINVMKNSYQNVKDNKIETELDLPL